ncbi:uncharacterized protein EHS24_002511 [Apiotrichum porosum]|uniref:Uncharacterized protein n=1 Tax=Apiotrichum porosum TaxID=105984 RepID=A0A427XGV8_9TREE|nr:uncharacterized protein EHS24_002511 [Apiotrichum porosum]RSH78056.1 hypothetical protein EHS24_002511 [Apiotrichum porosum]
MTSPTRLSTYTTLLTRTTPTPRSERFQVFLTSLTETLRAASFGHYLTIDSTAAPTSPVLAQSRQAADALLYEVLPPPEFWVTTSTASHLHSRRHSVHSASSSQEISGAGGSGGGTSAGAKLRPAPYALFKRRGSTHSSDSSSSPRPTRPTSTPPLDTGALSMTATSAPTSRGARSERGSRSAVDSSARPTKWPLPLDALYLEQAWHGSRALGQTIAQGLQLTQQQLSGQLSQLAPRRIPTPAPTHRRLEDATPAIILTPADASPPNLPPVQPRSPRMGILDMTSMRATPERPALAYVVSPLPAEQRQSHNSGSTLLKVLRGG